MNDIISEIHKEMKATYTEYDKQLSPQAVTIGRAGYEDILVWVDQMNRSTRSIAEGATKRVTIGWIANPYAGEEMVVLCYDPQLADRFLIHYQEK